MKAHFTKNSQRECNCESCHMASSLAAESRHGSAQIRLDATGPKIFQNDWPPSPFRPSTDYSRFKRSVIDSSARSSTEAGIFQSAIRPRQCLRTKRFHERRSLSRRSHDRTRNHISRDCRGLSVHRASLNTFNLSDYPLHLCRVHLLPTHID